MRALRIFIATGLLATLLPTTVHAQVLRDATIPFQQPRFDNLRSPSIRLQPIQRENIRPPQLQLTPIQRKSFPRPNIRPPQIRISPITRNNIPRENFNLQPLRIAPLQRDVIRRDNIRPPAIAPTPILVKPLVLAPLVREPLTRTTIQFDTSILGFPRAPRAATTPATRRDALAASKFAKAPRRKSSAGTPRSQNPQATGRRPRQSLGW